MHLVPAANTYIQVCPFLLEFPCTEEYLVNKDNGKRGDSGIFVHDMLVRFGLSC